MPNPRAFAVKVAGKLHAAPFDFIELPHDGRYRRRITMRTSGDMVFLLDLAEPVHLRHGDGLVLEDGRIIGVVAADEPVAEITAADRASLDAARLAHRQPTRAGADSSRPHPHRARPDHRRDGARARRRGEEHRGAVRSRGRRLRGGRGAWARAHVACAFPRSWRSRPFSCAQSRACSCARCTFRPGLRT